MIRDFPCQQGAVHTWDRPLDVRVEGRRPQGHNAHAPGFSRQRLKRGALERLVRTQAEEIAFYLLATSETSRGLPSVAAISGYIVKR
jgi:hypothetical protein